LTDLDNSSYTTIAAGETVHIVHEGRSQNSQEVHYLPLFTVTSLFDFASAGPGRFSFKPNTNFQVIGADENVTAPSLTKVQASITPIYLEAEVIGDVVKRKFPQLNKRVIGVCRNSSRESFMEDR
jgi:deuterolysin